ncbi:cytochrome P450 2J2-like [Glandiceps talaboti]
MVNHNQASVAMVSLKPANFSIPALATRCYDKTWKRQRAFTTFVHRNLSVGSNSNLQNVLNVEVSNFLGHLQALHGAPFKPNVIVLKASMNVFCGILFDRRFEYDDSRLEELVNKLNDFDSEIQGNHDMFTYMQFSWYLLYSRKRRVQKVYSDLLGLLADLIDEQTETHVEGKIRHVLDVYIQEVTKQEEGERSIFEEDASPRDCLKHTIVEYFYTGAITLAKTMETLFMQIIERPDIQKRVRNEISNVKLVNGHRSPTIEDIENSRFSYATILEVLRLYPVESISWPRCSTRDGVIGGYGIPKGTVILTNIYAIHRDSGHWDNPDEFNPQRFIDMSTGKVQLNERSAFLPWSIGPRKCVGEVISRLVVWSFFASVMQRFQLITPNDKNGNQELLNGYMPYVFARNKIETVEICAVETTKAVHTTKVK